nr:hypothetical protein [Segatella oulorum]
MWYQQQPMAFTLILVNSCDLLKNIYLCGINNNSNIERNYLTTL